MIIDVMVSRSTPVIAMDELATHMGKTIEKSDEFVTRWERLESYLLNSLD